VVVLLIRWQVKFGSLGTSDADYKKALRNRNFGLLLLIVAIPLGFIVRPLLGLIVAAVLSRG